jgi:hypothetical protein
MISRHLETLFCDDIRHELGGKLSFIGVYSGVLFVPTFPATLTKLCLSATIITPVEEPLRTLTLSVLKNDTTLHEMHFSEDQLAAASDLAEEVTDRQEQDNAGPYRFLMVFSPIQFDEPCALRVRAQTEDGELYGLVLKVESPPALEESSP